MESGRFVFDPSLCSGNMLFLESGNNPIFRGARSVMSVEESSKRRPFFSSPEDLYDEEYYDEQSPEKKRRLTAEQVFLLEKSFEEENKLEPERKTQLAKKLGLQPRQVAVWFQNRRARWKTKQLERDYDLLKSTYDALLLSYDAIAKDNEQLKSEVISLTEKLQAKEATGGAPTAAQGHDPTPSASTLQLGSVKVEDRLSSGSGGSAVVDEDGRQLLDSGDSYFDYPGCIGPVDGVQSEEDDRSEDGQSYFPGDVFAAAAAAAAEHEEGEPMGWWVWS
ncbi:homeobox-leucine zipper protein HAT5 [Punica granatum]|uniref:Homeobox-leucine zipper protein n=2 Tax=Punica granatum TaxID=22663 RepID=A0A218WHS4_PUNGR|nr:homeobox-leucine zipper protein HAT5 [Punica granatum]OWM71552.1 hypothetical protein CDL15_Pgr005739 [Punica granatum]PKI49463.1 hypothetical protein CRG98_030155 [Punica granatum]